MIAEDLVVMILANSAVTTIIGSGSSCRFYPVTAPVNTPAPYCVYLKLAPGRLYNHQGYAGFQQAQYQISCFHTTPSGVAALDAAIVAALEAWRTTKVKAVFIDEERDLRDEETKFFHVPVTFTVVYEG